ncbi:MAG: diguanylate cyclase [Candidatus Doudnabacteria bacterium]|nr:diguanylate cyclase [Candidatus Doudnabacteria bacterium]
MRASLIEKVALINQTTLKSLNASELTAIIRKFTETGTKILNADYAFVWWQFGKKYRLIYRSPHLPFTPVPPRKKGFNSKVTKNRLPLFRKRIPNLDPKLDIGQYVVSYLITPITYKNNLYGNIVFCYKKIHNFSNMDRSLSIALGHSLAQTITINHLNHNLQDIKHTLDNTPEPLLIFDPVTQSISYYNQSLLMQTGRNKSQLQRAKISDIVHSSSQKIFQKRLKRVVANKVPSSIFEVALASVNHQKIPAEISLQYVNLPKQAPHLLAIIRDLREKKKSEQQIRHAAFHDTLTGLPNRFSFTKKLTPLMRAKSRGNRRFAIIFMDLDRFKLINDTLGHLMGDALLKQVAHRLKGHVKRSDMVSRFAGDEFVILLGNLQSFKEIDQVVERIQTAFQDPFKLSEKQEIYVTFSMGISIFPKDGTTADLLLKNADYALYQAKQEGGNNYKYYDNYVRTAQPGYGK